jgi:hypothetical protein
VFFFNFVFIFSIEKLKMHKTRINMLRGFSTDNSSNRNENQEDLKHYNNSLSDDYEDFIKNKSLKLRRKSKSLLERLPFNNEQMTVYRKSTGESSSLNFETKSQDRVSDTQSNLETCSSVCIF